MSSDGVLITIIRNWKRRWYLNITVSDWFPLHRHRKGWSINTLISIGAFDDSLLPYVYHFNLYSVANENRFQREAKKSGAKAATYSESAVRWTEQTIITLAFCFLTLCPIYILSYVTSQSGKLALILAFVLAVSFFTADFSTNIGRTNLAVIAAYVPLLIISS